MFLRPGAAPWEPRCAGQCRNGLIQYKIRVFFIQKFERRLCNGAAASTSDSVVLPLRNNFSAGTILISFICLFIVVGGMYFVSSRREASLLIPEQPVPESGAPSAGSEPPLTPEILRQRIMPFLAGLRDRAGRDWPRPAPEADPAVISGVIAKGDSASELLSPYLSASSVQQLLDVTKKVHPLSRIRTGQPYTLVRTPGGDGMERFEYEIDDQKKLIVTKTGEGFAAHVEPIVYDFNLVRVSGTIRSSLFETLASTGESPILAVRIAEIFGSEINFIKDLREGDGFSLLIEKRFRGEAFKGYGRVLGATFTNQGKTYEAYRFVTEDGEAFFNAKGESLKKTLLKAPLAFTRISSGYSMNRKHPIFKNRRPHQGVD